MPTQVSERALRRNAVEAGTVGEPRVAEVDTDDLARSRPFLNQIRPLGPSTERFDRKGTGPRVEVEHPGSYNGGTQHGEHGLSHLVARRSRLHAAGSAEMETLGLTGDHAH
jgi:hypothetical protein